MQLSVGRADTGHGYCRGSGSSIFEAGTKAPAYDLGSTRVRTSHGPYFSAGAISSHRILSLHSPEISLAIQDENTGVLCGTASVTISSTQRMRRRREQPVNIEFHSSPLSAQRIAVARDGILSRLRYECLPEMNGGARLGKAPKRIS